MEAHLPSCGSCRASLFWMQATHRALAARPVAVPPADLHSRIAEAIAASSAAPSLRPVRSFTLRPAYAAAASLTVLGVILGHSLLHSPVSSVPNISAARPAPPRVAVVPPAPQKVKSVLPPSVRVKAQQALVARNVPAAAPQHDLPKSIAAEHALAPRKTVLVNADAAPDQVASNAPAPVHALAPLHVQIKPAAHSVLVHFPAASSNKMASAKVPSAAKRPSAVTEIIKPRPAEVPMLARHDKETLPVQVHIEPPIVTVPSPAAHTVSLTSASGDALASVRAFTGSLRTAPLAKTSFAVRQASVGATNALHSLATEHSGYQPAVYTP